MLFFVVSAAFYHLIFIIPQEVIIITINVELAYEDADVALRDAASIACPNKVDPFARLLSPRAFAVFDDLRKKASEYSVQDLVPGVSATVIYRAAPSGSRVHTIDLAQAPARCDCKEDVALGMPCRHLVAYAQTQSAPLNITLSEEYFHPRWRWNPAPTRYLLRSRLTVIYDGISGRKRQRERGGMSTKGEWVWVSSTFASHDLHRTGTEGHPALLQPP